MTRSRQIVEQIAEVARDVEPKVPLCPRRRPCRRRRRRCPPLPSLSGAAPKPSTPFDALTIGGLARMITPWKIADAY